MQKLKDQLLTILRDEKTARDEFRRTTHKLSHILAQETAMLLDSEPYPIRTPVAEMVGTRCAEEVIIVPILRSGLAMLPAFQKYFEKASIGILGFKRNSKTFEAELYYSNLPGVADNHRYIIIDPMLATGGTAEHAINLLLQKGVHEEKIIFVGILCSPEGKTKLLEQFPKIKIILGAEDDHLNQVKYIVPGLGDYGDRYFGTE